MSTFRKSILLLILAIASAGAATVFRPNHRLADQRPPIALETGIPKHFGDWHIEQDGGVVINPQSQTLVNKLYSEVLMRNYFNARTGEHIMLSIAYGPDQGDSVALHLPDVCYPAQGFSLINSQHGSLFTSLGDISVKRLVMSQGSRIEPITYWTTVGDKVALGGFDTKTTQISYGFNGVIPDGLIFRISSISSEPEKTFENHQHFVQDLLPILPAEYRIRLSGLGGKNSIN